MNPSTDVSRSNRPGRPGRRMHCHALAWVAALVMAAVPGSLLLAGPPPTAERLHARAVESFRQGRFPEAYGRFIDSANAGHPNSARYALWMCEHGMPLFGKDWDCAPHEVEDWARAAGVPQPVITAPTYKTPRRGEQTQRWMQRATSPSRRSATGLAELQGVQVTVPHQGGTTNGAW